MNKLLLTTAVAAGCAALPLAWTLRVNGAPPPPLTTATAERVEGVLARVDLDPGRVATRYPAAESAPADVRAVAFQALKDSFAAQDTRAAGLAIETWFSSGPAAVDAILARLGDPATDQFDAEMNGILLQAAMLYARQGSPLVEPWRMEDLASASIALLDSGPYSARSLQLGLKPFGADLPGRCMKELLLAARADELVHSRYEAQFSALDLITEWTRTMGPDVEPVLHELATDPAQGALIRGDAVAGLLRRDWRAFVPELVQRFHEQRAGMEEIVRQHLELALSGHSVDLPASERLALLRGVDLENVTRTALENLAPAEARELSASATAEDRAWEGFSWISFRAGEEGWIDAGLALLARHERGKNRFVADSILQGLLAGAPEDPLVRNALEQRFERRGEARDPFWKALAFNLEQLPASVLRRDVREWLRRTQGESHPSRQVVLDKLRSAAPSAADGLM